MLTNGNVVKLGDMGEAKNIKNSVGRTYGGTVQYMSPEQKKGRQFNDQLEYSFHNAKTDIWLNIYYIYHSLN